MVIVWLLLGCAAAYGLTRVALGYPRPGERYECLNRAEAALVEGAAGAMFPPGGAIPESGLDADLPGYMDRLLAASHPRQRRQLHMLFFLIEHATLCFPAPGRGGLRRFSSLSHDQRVDVLQDWATSNLFFRRLCFTSLRALLTLGYFAHPPVTRRLGVAPPAVETPVCEADLLYPPIGAGPEAIAFTADDLTEPSDGTPILPGAPRHRRYVEDLS